MTTATVDIASRPSIQTLVETATALGDVTGSSTPPASRRKPAPPAAILHVDLYGTAVILEEFGNVIAAGGSGVVIASQSGHRLRCPHRRAGRPALATTPPRTASLRAYQARSAHQLATAAPFKAEAVGWAERGPGSTRSAPGSS